MKFWDRLVPESARRFFACFSDEGRIDELGRDLVRKERAVVPILLAATQRDPSAHDVASPGTIFDITERRRAEVAREQLAAIVDYSNDAIISKTLEGIIVSWNKGAEQLYGYSEKEAIGKSISMLLPLDHEDELAKILGSLRQGGQIEHEEAIRRTKDDRVIHVSRAIYPIKDATGRLTGAAGVAHDME